MRVAALYRYPIKGFTAEECEFLRVLKGGRIAGDRVLGVRFANSSVPGDAWGTKHEFVALVNTPGLTRLRLRFDHEVLRIRITLQTEVVVDEVLSEVGRKRCAAAIEKYVLGLDVSPLALHSERIPLRLVGDGTTPRYQDNENGYVTLHGRRSLAAVAAASDAPDLSEHRFRSNIAIEGIDAWAEQAWIGRKIRIGAVSFVAVSAKSRCLATHANPVTGHRDLPIMQTLLRVFPQEKPTFAIAMTATDHGGTIHVGDEVEVIG